MIYVTKFDFIGGDSFECYFGESLEEARTVAKFERDSTSYDLKRVTIYVNGYDIEVKNGQTAEDAFFEWWDQTRDYDPVYSETIWWPKTRKYRYDH